MSSTTEKKKFCHCKRSCGRLLSKRQRLSHCKKSSDSSTIESSESEYEVDNTDPSDDMDLDKPLPFHAQPEFTIHSPLDIDDNISDFDDLLMDVDPPSDNPSLSECESDSELEDYEGGLYLDELPELDEWKAFDEERDQEEPLSRDEMMRGLEEMLEGDDEAALWDPRAYTFDGLGHQMS